MGRAPASSDCCAPTTPAQLSPTPTLSVFAHPITGEPLGHRLMYERLRAALKTAGLDEAFAWHTLRHS